MKLFLLLPLALLAIVPLIGHAQEALPPGVAIWPKGTPPQGIGHKDDYGRYILSVSHREKNGVVELHEVKCTRFAPKFWYMGVRSSAR